MSHESNGVWVDHLIGTPCETQCKFCGAMLTNKELKQPCPKNVIPGDTVEFVNGIPVQETPR